MNVADRVAVVNPLPSVNAAIIASSLGAGHNKFLATRLAYIANVKAAHVYKPTPIVNQTKLVQGKSGTLLRR